MEKSFKLEIGKVIEEQVTLSDRLAEKDAQMQQWHLTLGAKDELIQKLQAENEDWKQRHQSRVLPDPQSFASSSGSTQPTLEQLTAAIMPGGWPNLNGYPTAAQRAGYGVYQPGPGIGMLPPAPLVSTGVIPSFLPFGSIPTYSLPPPLIPQSAASLSIPPSTLAFQPTQASTQIAGPTQTGPTQTGPTQSGLSQAGPMQTQPSTAADQQQYGSNRGERGGHGGPGNSRNSNWNKGINASGFQQQYPPYQPNSFPRPAQQSNSFPRTVVPPVPPTITSNARPPYLKMETAEEQISALRKQNEDMRLSMFDFDRRFKEMSSQMARMTVGRVLEKEEEEESLCEDSSNFRFQRLQQNQTNQNQNKIKSNQTSGPTSQSTQTYSEFRCWWWFEGRSSTKR